MAAYLFRSAIAQEFPSTTASLPESRFNSRDNFRQLDPSSTAHSPIAAALLPTATLKRCRFTSTRRRCFKLPAVVVVLAEVAVAAKVVLPVLAGVLRAAARSAIPISSRGCLWPPRLRHEHRAN